MRGAAKYRTDDRWAACLALSRFFSALLVMPHLAPTYVMPFGAALAGARDSWEDAAGRAEGFETVGRCSLGERQTFRTCKCAGKGSPSGGCLFSMEYK